MKRKHFGVAWCSVLVLLMASSFCHAAMQDDVDQAVTILKRFQRMPESQIPEEVLRDAKGLAIMTITKAGFVFSGRGGTGVVVAKTYNGWSGPCAIGTGGIGFGLQIGVQVSEVVMVLNTDDAVRAFSREGNVTLGADLSAAAGPVGRTLQAAVAPMAAVYTYSLSQGLFVGISLEGTGLGTRDEANEEYYGRPVHASEILSGMVKPPEAARALMETLSVLRP
jgi:SH3 domain-containing YSC84-like protein 1